MVDVTNHTFAFALEFSPAVFETAVEFVEPGLGRFEIGGKGLRVISALLHVEQLSKAEVLAMDQRVEADFEMSGDSLCFARTLGGDFGEHRVQCAMDEILFGGRSVRQAVAVRG